MFNNSQEANKTSFSDIVIETTVTAMTGFLVMIIIIQNTIVLTTIKTRSSPISILFISLSISDFLLALQSAIYLISSTSVISATMLSISLISSLSVCSMIALDKAVSLACPFFYSNIVTHSTVSRGVVTIWIVSISFSITSHIIIKPYTDNKDAHPHPLRLVLLLLNLLLLLISVSCHLYVYKVAHRHTKTITKTQRSHHASMQRLNSICIVNRDSITPYPPCYLTTPLPVPLQLPTNTRQSRTALYLLLPPLSLLLSWLPYLTGTFLRLDNQHMVTIQLPLLFLASVNPWVYGKLPQNTAIWDKIFTKTKTKDKQSDCNQVIKMTAMSAVNMPDEETQHLNKCCEDSSLNGSESKNYQSMFDHSTMNLTEMVSHFIIM